MSKKIEDYLHLYLPFTYRYFGIDYEITGLQYVKEEWVTLYHRNGFFDLLLEDVRLPIRPLSSMTEEEMKECGNLDYDYSDDPELNVWDWKTFDCMISSNQFIWLLSHHFDLFGLIDVGLAIDKTKINQP